MRLKKEESETSKIIKESQYEELLNRNHSLEKRIQSLELSMSKYEVHVNHTTPLQISKSFDKAVSKIENIKADLEE